MSFIFRVSKSTSGIQKACVFYFLEGRVKFLNPSKLVKVILSNLRNSVRNAARNAKVAISNSGIAHPILLKF